MKKMTAILLGLAMSFCICTPVSAAVSEGDGHVDELHQCAENERNTLAVDTGFACPKCGLLGIVKGRYYEPLTGTFTNIVWCEDCRLEWNVYHYYSLRNVEQ